MIPMDWDVMKNKHDEIVIVFGTSAFYFKKRNAIRLAEQILDAASEENNNDVQGFFNKVVND